MAVILPLGGVDVVLLAFTKVDLKLGALGVGYLVSALAAGLILGSLVAESLTARLAPAVWLGIGRVGLGTFFGLAGTVPVLAVTLGAMVVAGVFNGIINVRLSTFVQSLVPMGISGRVFALLGTLTRLALLWGMAANTGLLAFVGPGRTLVLVGGWVAAVGLLGAARLRVSHAPPPPMKPDLATDR